MKNVGIICEYNPFHTGHARQILLVREGGGECVICIMSGNYTQRGEPAIFDKYTRAAAAVSFGADIVLELPFPFCCASAENFARAGVHILSHCGVDTLSFGCECGDISSLQSAADMISGRDFQAKYAELQKSGRGSASAFFDAFAQTSGKNADFLSNDLLAISYLRAISELSPSMTPFAVKREGAGYNDSSLGDSYPSASALRVHILSDGASDNSLSKYIPSSALTHYLDAMDKGDAPVGSRIPLEHLHAFFRLNSPNEIRSRAISLCGGEGILDDGDGILNRICDVASSATNDTEFYSEIFNSRYTDSRVRRVLIYSLIGVSDAYRHALPEYTTLLAASPKGREYLSGIRKSAGIPIVTKPADIPDCVSSTLSARADSLYTLLMPQKRSGSSFIRRSPFIL